MQYPLDRILNRSVGVNLICILLLYNIGGIFMDSAPVI